ncbi:MAG TPA: hypothetical protein VI197_17925 [Polyangiaceae bacterium]
MAEQRKIKRKANQKKPTAKPRRRLEQRFLPKTTSTGWALLGIGMLGALALGAGVFGQWVQDPPVDYAVYLIAAGAAGLAAALWFGELSATPVRVGDAGIALEKGAELVRFGWCDIENVSIEKDQLFVKTAESSFAIPVAAHPQAIAWLLKEGVQRVPDVVNVKRRDLAQLPKPEASAGEELQVEGLQVAGRRCKQSDKLISFEEDARLCPNCCEVYHRLHVPKDCATCKQTLGTRAITP